MERISDEKLDEMIYYCGDSLLSYHNSCYEVAEALQELKERREADSKPLDIKGQLRLVRDKCPGMWDLIVTSLYACPSMIDTGLQPNLLDSEDICYGFGNDNCKECWGKALEGDE